MKVTPAVTVTRFAQLTGGELFLFEHASGACVGLVVEDPTQNGEKLILPLGPELPPHMSWPTLQSPRAFTAISFGKDFEVRLSTEPHGWTSTEPPPNVRTILVADDRAYFRANFGHDAETVGLYRPCFVDLATGLICASGKGPHEQYNRPVGTAAFVIEWEITTSEEKPRTILAYKRPEGE